RARKETSRQRGPVTRASNHVEFSQSCHRVRCHAQFFRPETVLTSATLGPLLNGCHTWRWWRRSGTGADVRSPPSIDTTALRAVVCRGEPREGAGFPFFIVVRAAPRGPAAGAAAQEC